MRVAAAVFSAVHLPSSHWASTRPAGRVVQVGLAGGTAHVTALKTVKPEVSVSYGAVRRTSVNCTKSSHWRNAFWPLEKINDGYGRVKHGQVAGRAMVTPWRPRRF